MKKRIVSIALVGCMVFALAACGSSSDASDETAASAEEEAAVEEVEEAAAVEEEVEAEAEAEVAEASADGATVALIVSALSSIDDRGFFESTWAGVQEFCEDTGLSCTWYQPTENSVDALYEITDLAINNGAEVIVTTGGDFIGMMEDMFASYPDITWVCNEIPFTEPGDNSVIYIFQAQQASFLLGYAAVVEGFKDIGVMAGLPILPVQRAGFGFVQGVNLACEELGVDDVAVRYWYSNSLDQSADIQATAAAWYQSGVDFVAGLCGGGTVSVFAAAEANDGLASGSDVDQSYLSDTCITSTLKNVKQSSIDGLYAWYDGTFDDELAGQLFNMTIAEDGISLEMDNGRFQVFDQEMYDELVDRILSGDITIYSVEDYEEVTDLWDDMDHYFDFTYIE